MQRTKSLHSPHSTLGNHEHSSCLRAVTPVSHKLTGLHLQMELQQLSALSQIFHGTINWKMALPSSHHNCESCFTRKNQKTNCNACLVPYFLFCTWQYICSKCPHAFPLPSLLTTKVHLSFHFQRSSDAFSCSSGSLSRQMLWSCLSSFLHSAFIGIWQQGTSFFRRTTWLRSVTLD